jgi:hypothetical protein
MWVKHASRGGETMLYRYCGKFLEYCRLADFSDRSMQALEIRLGKFQSFARTFLAPGSIHV